MLSTLDENLPVLQLQGPFLVVGQLGSAKNSFCTSDLSSNQKNYTAVIRPAHSHSLSVKAEVIASMARTAEEAILAMHAVLGMDAVQLL